MKKPIFFDLDGTLIEGNSWYMFNLYFGMSQKEDEMMINWYRQGVLAYNEWIDLIVKILRQKNKCTQEKIAEFNKTISPRPGTIEVMRTCKEQGYTPIIISGTIKQIAEDIGEFIGADTAYTTSEIIFNKDGVLETINNKEDEGQAKLRIFEKVCAEFGISPEEAIYVGDSGNDIQIFEKTNKGILIGDYEKLKPLAWKQVQNLSEITQLL
jgi:HAD superfamily phosphoserine phosphatase-like hydrolase